MQRSLQCVSLSTMGLTPKLNVASQSFLLLPVPTYHAHSPFCRAGGRGAAGGLRGAGLCLLRAADAHAAAARDAAGAGRCARHVGRILLGGRGRCLPGAPVLAPLALSVMLVASCWVVGGIASLVRTCCSCMCLAALHHLHHRLVCRAWPADIHVHKSDHQLASVCKITWKQGP